MSSVSHTLLGGAKIIRHIGHDLYQICSMSSAVPSFPRPSFHFSRYPYRVVISNPTATPFCTGYKFTRISEEASFAESVVWQRASLSTYTNATFSVSAETTQTNMRSEWIKRRRNISRRRRRTMSGKGVKSHVPAPVAGEGLLWRLQREGAREAILYVHGLHTLAGVQQHRISSSAIWHSTAITPPRPVLAAVYKTPKSAGRPVPKG